MLKRNFLMIVCATLLMSCSLSKRVAYIPQAEELGVQPVAQDYQPRIKKDDVLSIFVYSQDPLLSAPFNMELAQQQILTGSMANSTTQNRAYEEGRKGFIVDAEGDIQYPVFGEIHVEGKTRLEVADTIRHLLITNGYIKDPVVNVRFLNFKVTVLGEVARPGVIEVASDRITLFDALADAGDMTIFGRRQDVKIVREVDGKRQVHLVDINAQDIFESELYYLQQNDIVYVEPNKSKAFQGQVSTFWSPLFSAINLLTTIGLYFAK